MSETDRGDVQYDSVFFDTLRSYHADDQQQAAEAERGALQWPRASDEAERLLSEAQMRHQNAAQVANRLNSAMAGLQLHCELWGLSMPDCDENGWAR